MGLEIRIVKNVLHFVPDESTSRWTLKYSTDNGTTWTDIFKLDYKNNIAEVIYKIKDDISLVFGSDSDFKIKYNSTTDTLQVLDINDNVVGEYLKL
jgi:hypothetical protein